MELIWKKKKDFKTSAENQTKTSYCGNDTDMNTDKLYSVEVTYERH